MEDTEQSSSSTKLFGSGCFTSGSFANEDEGKSILDGFLLNCKAFSTHREVEGYIIQPRLGINQLGVRADRILIPRQEMADKGWRFGAILIECKAPGKPLGPVASQCMDYMRSAFVLPGSGVTVIPDYAFVWHLDKAMYDIGSVCHQHKIGGCSTRGKKLRFALSSVVLFDVSETGDFTFYHPPVGGSKAGSR